MTTQDTTFLNDLIERRRKLIEGLDANKGEVNLDIFEDFYPDRAHFVYELLQNAEDAGATQVAFVLDRNRLVCEHDGRRTFTRDDVSAITGIHNSTKANSPDRIGKFGVGFKSVFVYTQTPIVRSGGFSFRILQMILPEPIPDDPSLGHRTQFEFPFDNPKKPPAEAHDEIAAGLSDLDETTLLFLTNLRTIKWSIGGSAAGEVSREQHSAWHFEVSRRGADGSKSSRHFLKFDQAVADLGTHRLAIAFPLELLPGVREFDTVKPIAEQLRIVAASPGRVAVFFTAAKEASGLLFHLHAPFVPELSRASIKETPANEPLFDRLAALCARSLHNIRDLDLLTPEFLAILPNPEDQLPRRYQPIRDAIVAKMREQPLTPTHDRGHAAADRLVQARATLKALLSNDDIEFLIDYDEDPPLWAIGATQRNSRIDNFLSALDIREWGIDQLVETLEARASDEARYIRVAPHIVRGPDEEFVRWLALKSPEWMQQFYALLHDEVLPSSGAGALRGLRIVRLNGGGFGAASQCFFADDQTGNRIPTVDPQVYTSGRSKPQQEKARKFLVDLGVRELGEAEEIELILKARYTKEAEIPDGKTYLRDLKRFIALSEQQPDKAQLFAPYYIFRGEDGDWYKPEGIYLDQPYRLTDLRSYYGGLGEDADCEPLDASYRDCGVAVKRITTFAELTGARVELPIDRGYCRDNPQWAHLRSVGGDRLTSPRDSDYFVPHLAGLLKTPSIGLSRLIWRTITALPPDSHFFKAAYRRNYSGGTHYADSRLVHDLRAAMWVPQRDSIFVRPAEASSELLPQGFPYDAGYKALEAIQFGAEAKRASAQERQKDSVAKMAGFADAGALERAKRFAALPEEEQERFFAELERAGKGPVPDRTPANPQRRAQTVSAQAENAPDKESEIRSRAVSIGREDVKVLADQYLRQHYRNSDGEMTCQICRGPLPFKLDDGSEFFETVEFLPRLRKRHFQNYLALCPNHSAMYRHANASSGIICEMVENLTGNELDVVLAQRDMTIYLSTVHALDIKAVLAAEANLPVEADDEDAA